MLPIGHVKRPLSLYGSRQGHKLKEKTGSEGSIYLEITFADGLAKERF